MASGSLSEDPGLFGPHSILWRVNRESAVTLAGTCAILMQFAHPKVDAGVREHSRYQVDAVGRLRRTLDLTLAIVFGPRPAALEAVRAINARHRSVRGSGFFFSSRRRHTRFDCDWSSDVCSSDLSVIVWATVMRSSCGDPVMTSRVMISATFIPNTRSLLAASRTTSRSDRIPTGRPEIGRASCRERV